MTDTVPAYANANALAQQAVELLVQQLPTATPLTAVPLGPGQAPSAASEAIRVHFVGSTSADLVLVAHEAIAEALAGAGVGVTAAEILRPALEAAARPLGAGVLDTAHEDTLGDALVDPDMEAFVLVDADGTAQAWFGIRVRQNRQQTAPAVAPAPAPTTPVDDRARMHMLRDVELVLTAEIGRTRLPMRQVLDLVPGTVLELDRAAGAPADVMVNGRLVARGEVVVVDEDYGIRITEIVTDEDGR
ncbi:flagellar motor switch protein FliN [Demequina capsici]|uniref:Flagellar motor switch protein FliN n=1 Tax=Demequina capsici TaxID=3075620 RepID=A0AA96FDF7_9MICO|nr:MULTISPECIES: flagellar motor switch protein FliN [unclassified Demequina]WNM24564.1 flagellar motor switch protein FliN [Demequina sp. OYTSA14]WNM27415.1 flagellar motor switch protein FliN [Demequina sp. PMTSA13]